MKSKTKDKNIIKKENKMLSNVEQVYLERSNKQLIYSPSEKIPIIQVNNFPELGKLTALRFIEWVQNNPGGVVSLPTGKTPEHFIKWVSRILSKWGTNEIDELLKTVNIDTKIRPDMKSLKFVQIDEFYPINSTQHNSFYYYIQKYYMNSFELDSKNALLININEIPTAENLSLDEIFPEKIVDLSLRTRWASSRQERIQKRTIEIVDEFCTNYESKIRKMGGIGFFLGGIGPDGHIGFNVQGSDHYSTTRLIVTNYETQAAASTDLGGIEIARNRLVITIGLDTISYNQDAVAIIIAAGEAKSRIVRDSIENSPTNKYPATVLQKLKNSRFYLTDGAALRLMERRYQDFLTEEPLSQISIERAIVNLVLERNKPLMQLNFEDYNSEKFAKLILERTGLSYQDVNKLVWESLQQKFQKGMDKVENEVILHTAPHHDDIELAYLPHIVHLFRNPSNVSHFTYLTSGFTAVTNSYILEVLQNTKSLLDSGIYDRKFANHYFDADFEEGKNIDVNVFLDGIASHSKTLKKDAVSRRMIRNIVEVYEEDSILYLKDRVNELISYFKTQYPGKKDIPHVQKLKGMLREWESEVFWGYFGYSINSVSHLRLGFYQGSIFTENPELNRDVLPVLQLLKRVKPTIVTVALDPEGSGPDTHYKVLQTVAEALKLYEKESGVSEIKVWGYRNVWYRFHPAEANIFVPVSLNSLAIQDNAFMNSFGSQKAASFPSWEYDGPFSRLAQKVQEEQYQTIRTCMGRDYFLKNEFARVRAAHGMVFLKELTLSEFYKHSTELKQKTENI